MADSDGKKYQGPNVSGSTSLSPYPTSRLAPAISLVDTAQEIESASEQLRGHTGTKLELIARQIRLLQEEARKVLDDAQVDLELHRAAASFRRIPGKIYHLYRKADGALSFSMLSPADHGGEPPHEFVGSYRLEYDRSWTRQEDIERRDAERVDVSALLDEGAAELAPMLDARLAGGKPRR